MTEDGLSASLEDYVEAIAEIIAEHGHAHTGDIADKLKVKMPSVTNALRVLSQQGYVEYHTSKPTLLTPKGEDLAKSVIRRHKALKRFFRGILRLSEKKSDEVACQIEHFFDPETTERFLIFMEVMDHSEEARSQIEQLQDTFDRVKGPG